MPKPTSRTAARTMAILWPSFLMAGVLEGLVFTMVEPSTLRWFGSEPLQLQPLTVYSLAFFIFWIVIAVAGLLTQVLLQTAEEVNNPELSRGRWPAR